MLPCLPRHSIIYCAPVGSMLSGNMRCFHPIDIINPHSEYLLCGENSAWVIFTSDIVPCLSWIFWVVFRHCCREMPPCPSSQHVPYRIAGLAIFPSNLNH